MKVAITGTGFMGMVHAEALKRLHIDVIGIQGSSPEKSQVAADQLGLAKAYASYDELILDPEVDAVHITTPNRHHFPMAMAALKSGETCTLREAIGHDLRRIEYAREGRL